MSTCRWNRGNAIGKESHNLKISDFGEIFWIIQRILVEYNLKIRFNGLSFLTYFFETLFFGKYIIHFSYFLKVLFTIKNKKKSRKFSFFDSNISKIGRDTRQSELPHWKWPLCGRGFTHFCGTAYSLPQAVCRVAKLRPKYAGISVPKLFCTGAPANWHAYTTRDAWSNAQGGNP